MLLQRAAYSKLLFSFISTNIHQVVKVVVLYHKQKCVCFMFRVDWLVRWAIVVRFDLHTKFHRHLNSSSDTSHGRTSSYWSSVRSCILCKDLIKFNEVGTEKLFEDKLNRLSSDMQGGSGGRKVVLACQRCRELRFAHSVNPVTRFGVSTQVCSIDEVFTCL
jgi:hypothetical protein